jgi:hypothetical protein
LRHAVPFQPAITVFQISLPFIIPRWSGDLHICSELINNLFEALANSARFYLADVTERTTNDPNASPRTSARRASV